MTKRPWTEGNGGYMSQTTNSECAKPSELKPCPDCGVEDTRIDPIGNYGYFRHKNGCWFAKNTIVNEEDMSRWNALPRTPPQPTDTLSQDEMEDICIGLECPVKHRLENLEAKIQTCPKGHKYYADSHEYPCTVCGDHLEPRTPAQPKDTVDCYHWNQDRCEHTNGPCVDSVDCPCYCERDKGDSDG